MLIMLILKSFILLIEKENIGYIYVETTLYNKFMNLFLTT